MSNENRSMVVIPSTVIEQILDLVAQANAALQPYVTPLTKEERRTILRMSDKTLAFVQKVHFYTNNNPEFIPRFLNTDEFEVDFQNTVGLEPLFKQAWQLCDNLSDTDMVAGSETYRSALMYYNSVKQADRNGIAGARAVYEDLQKRFPGRPKGPNPPPPPEDL